MVNTSGPHFISCSKLQGRGVRALHGLRALYCASRRGWHNVLTWAVNIYKSCVLGNATVLCIYLCSNLTTTEQKFAGIAEEMFRERLSRIFENLFLRRERRKKMVIFLRKLTVG